MGIDRPLPTSVSMMVSFSFFSFCKSIFVFCFQVASSFLNIVKVVVTMYDLAALKTFLFIFLKKHVSEMKHKNCIKPTEDMHPASKTILVICS